MLVGPSPTSRLALTAFAGRASLRGGRRCSPVDPGHSHDGPARPRGDHGCPRDGRVDPRSGHAVRRRAARHVDPLVRHGHPPDGRARFHVGRVHSRADHAHPPADRARLRGDPESGPDEARERDGCYPAPALSAPRQPTGPRHTQPVSGYAFQSLRNQYPARAVVACAHSYDAEMRVPLSGKFCRDDS